MNTIDKLLVLMYNLALLAGASYLVYEKDASAWLYVLCLLFGASWSNNKKCSLTAKLTEQGKK